MVSVILKKIILILFINIGIVIFVSVILNNIISLLLFICVVAKFPKDISAIVLISVYVNIFEIKSTQHYARIA